MKLLLDECLPRKMKFLFSGSGHTCETVREAGFGGKENGELLSLAEGKFEVLITVDKNLRHQQNLTNRRIAISVVRAASNDIDDIRPHLPEMLTALRSIKSGQIVEVGVHHQ
jgi:predicted nuclease of predicted toxin-antitoxin system